MQEIRNYNVGKVSRFIGAPFDHIVSVHQDKDDDGESRVVVFYEVNGEVIDISGRGLTARDFT